MKKQQTIEIFAQGLPPVSPLSATDHLGQKQTVFLVGEQPLTIYLNRVEVVTVMTMGTMPAALVIGFLLNQQLIPDVQAIKSIHVDWSVNAAAVSTHSSLTIENKTTKRIVTSGCGQGTMFSRVMENLTAYPSQQQITPLRKEEIYQLLKQLSQENSIYKKAGGVHSCALCTHEKVLKTVEDVGRHNAVDSLTGYLALNPETDTPSILYTTGRLTSEMVIKTAQMGVPFILSRSGATAMGVDIAKQAGIILIARAKGKRFLLLTGQQHVLT